MIRKLIPALLTATIALTAQECDGKAAKASYASDGVTMFGTPERSCSGKTKWCAEGASGKLKFGKTYTAEAVGSGKEFPDCEWSVYTVNANGAVRNHGHGGYRTAKVTVEQPKTVHVFLKSDGCGDWK